MSVLPEPPESASSAGTRSWRFRLALTLFVASYALGWPMIAGAGAATPWIGASNAALVGGAAYGLSWVLLGLAALLGGAEVASAGRGWVRERWRSMRG